MTKKFQVYDASSPSAPQFEVFYDDGSVDGKTVATAPTLGWAERIAAALNREEERKPT